MSRVEQRHDVRVLQGSRELDLAAEPLGVDPGRHLRGQHFHHHLPPELTLLGQEHATHPATAELVFDAEARAEGDLEASLEIRHAVTQGRWDDCIIGARARRGQRAERQCRIAARRRSSHLLNVGSGESC